MHVVATAGHVDHGKSTLVRAMTGMEPDRLAEEKRRGLTIELGYVWTDVAGETLAVVDVPGHERFIGTMLAGLGPVPAVLFVVAADEGWRQQSAEHLAAVDALGLRHGLLVVTRSDLADPAPAIQEARRWVARSSLGDVPAVTVSGRTGQGLDQLREALSRLTRQLPPPNTQAPVRLWIDRSFSVRGAGTVVTGTLGAGTLRVGDRLRVNGRDVSVRGLQQTNVAHDTVSAVGRVAVNLRGIERVDVGRGDVLLSAGDEHTATELDVRVHGVLGAEIDTPNFPAELALHVGTAAVPVRVRPLGADTARLRLAHPLPVRAGDHAVLRDPGRQTVLAGVDVLDAAPPRLQRRGAASRRAAELDDGAGPGPLQRDGFAPAGTGPPPDGSELHTIWWVTDDRWSEWTRQLVVTVDRLLAERPLVAGVPGPELVHRLHLPDAALLPELVAATGLDGSGGRVRRPGHRPSLGPDERALQQVEQALGERPFAAPEQPVLDELGLGARQLAVAVRTGRLVRLADSVYLRPDAPALAMRILAALQQPFTTAEARAALDTTRRVAIPLLEHLDERGWTRRLDAGHREVVR